jgi:hypothetical protein
LLPGLRWPPSVRRRSPANARTNHRSTFTEASYTKYLTFPLTGTIEAELAEAQDESQQTGKPARRFKDFTWSTRKSWSRTRRVIAKAEWTKGEANPRFIVTSLATGDGRELYEDIYCARGEMENRIKECQIDLFADRTSTRTMAANQLRRGLPQWHMSWSRQCVVWP